MGIDKNFVVKKGLEVGQNLIYANKDTEKIGIGTTTPQYSLDIKGDLALTGELYTEPENKTITTLSGIVSATSPQLITGINTSVFRLYDLVYDGVAGFVSQNTTVIGIGVSNIQIQPAHTKSSGVSVVSLTVTRNLYSGEDGDLLISRGKNKSPIWKPVSQVSVANTATNVVGGIGSITELVVSGSNASDLVRITQTGSGNALRVEDSSNPDSTSFIVDGDGQVGIKTDQPNYDLDVRGTILIGNSLYVKGGQLSTRVGIVSGPPYQNVISGIDTTGIEVSDFVDDSGSVINSNTIITSVGINSIQISPNHNRFSTTPLSINVTVTKDFYPGTNGEVLVSRGPGLPPDWSEASNTLIQNISTTTTYYPTFALDEGFNSIGIAKSEIVFISNPGNLGIGSTIPTERLDIKGNVKISGSVSIGETTTVGFLTATNVRVSGVTTVGFLTATNISVAQTVTTNSVNANNVTAITYFGDGVNLSGIATQITAGIGVRLTSTQAQGKGVVNIDSYFPIGKTIFVTQNGKDTNSGLTESDSKKTIKAAAAIAFPGDTIKVFPGVYVEENPIYLSKRVAVEGTELRNCVVTPKYTNRDLFYVNNSCHITDLSFIGPDMTDGASIVALQPLAGVASDRFFDAARMIRYNLDFIASETVGYLTSTAYKSPAFVIPTGNPNDCKDDIKDIFKAVIHDITRGGNSKCVNAGKAYYTDVGALQHIVGVKTETIDAIRYAAGIAVSCINNVSWNGNYQSQHSQVKDLSMQNDPITGSNININSCSNVVSAIYSCVGVVTTIINNGLSVLGVGIKTSFPANAGIGTNSLIGITSAVYNNETGQTTIKAPNLSVKVGDIIELRDLIFNCTSNGTIGTQRYPSGNYGYEFDVTKINSDGSFIVNTGVSTLAHNYLGGGFVVNRAIGVTTAVYSHVTGITTITAPGAIVKVGDFVKLHDLEFSCSSGAGTTTLYPTGNLGYEFKVLQVIGAGTTFVVNTGVTTIPHTYVKGGVVFPPYSPGVGPITQGPYIRNCTNFIPKSIGMKVDGFHAEPGDQDDIGVTGTMSVDSYTQYNQGGIGVSVTNGAYAQLVSIFTICDDIAIYTASGGQCDITNSNCSFGNYGLYSNGVGDYTTKSIYRYTGIAHTIAEEEQDVIVISGVGSQRPYDGQVVYFGELYYRVESVAITNGGSGYTQPPNVTIDFPTGPSGIRAEAISRIDSSGKVIAIDVISTGSQYKISDSPTITIGSPNSGTTATAQLNLYPIYYTVESATLPVAGISTVVLAQNLNNTVGTGTTVYFNRLSLQIATSISLEWVGAGTNITTAKPALGGVSIQENEVVKLNGGQVVYTSTNQAGNFQIGDDIAINQLTGTISGRSFNQSILNTVTPLIIALGR